VIKEEEREMGAKLYELLDEWCRGDISLEQTIERLADMNIKYSHQLWRELRSSNQKIAN
jgi:hypothetical protein